MKVRGSLSPGGRWRQSGGGWLKSQEGLLKVRRRVWVKTGHSPLFLASALVVGDLLPAGPKGRWWDGMVAVSILPYFYKSLASSSSVFYVKFVAGITCLVIGWSDDLWELLCLLEKSGAQAPGCL